MRLLHVNIIIMEYERCIQNVTIYLPYRIVLKVGFIVIKRNFYGIFSEVTSIIQSHTSLSVSTIDRIHKNVNTAARLIDVRRATLTVHLSTNA